MKRIIQILSIAAISLLLTSFYGLKVNADESIERGLWAVWLGDPFPGYLSEEEQQKMLDIGTSYLVACIPNDSVYMDFCDSTGGSITMNIEGPRQQVHPVHQKLWGYITDYNPPDTAVITQYIQAMCEEYGNHVGLKTYMIMHETAAYDSNKNSFMQYACQQVHAMDPNPEHYTLVVAPINILNSNPNFFDEVPDLDIFEMDCYPFYYNCPYDGSTFQQALDGLITAYQTTKDVTDTRKVAWHAVIQTHGSGDPATFGFRLPTRQEIQCQAFLALTRGTKGIVGFTYGSMHGPWEFYYGPLTPDREIAHYDSRPGDTLSSMYEDVRDLFHVLDSIGNVMHRVKSLQSFNSQNIPAESYIDSVVGDEIINGKGTVEIGTFVDTTVSPHVPYFMLVNRKCLETEGDSFDIFITKANGPYQIREMYTNSIIDTIGGVGDYFTVYLGPGEGKLFRLEETFVSPHVIKVPADYATIQQAIDAATNGDTVLVAPGLYLENINFKGKGILVGSYHIFDQDTATISQTIIDGSDPDNPDSASVVTFVSDEDSTSILKGFTITGGTGTSQWGPGRPEHRGGGIFCSYSSPTIVNNLIIDNHIPDHGSDFEWGGGIGCYVSSPTIANNLILNNSCYDGGAGICLKNGGSPIIVNNTLSENGGDGICFWGNDGFNVSNNIIVNNTDAGIWLVYNPSYVTGISYNDAWNNSGGNFVNCPSELGDTTWGTNYNGTPCDSFYNIIRDPLFVDPKNNNFYLQESSPCIDAGDSLSCPPYKADAEWIWELMNLTRGISVEMLMVI